MKQLLIVKGSAALNGGAAAPTDLSGMAKGSIGFFHLDDYTAWLSAAATKNFGIALGGGTDARAFLIPEVDFSSLTVVKASPATGTAKTVTVTFPTPVKGKEYTVIIAKKGVVFNERSNWTSSIVASTTTAATEANKLVANINANNSIHGVKATLSGSTITLTGAVGIDFEVKLADELSVVTPTVTREFAQSVGQPADIKELALACAAGKGFNYLAEDGKEIYPGFPENVEDTPYIVYTLRFKVGRSASKQRDEQVYQLVHIAVPQSSSSVETLDTILGVGTTPTPSVEDGD